MAKKERDYSNLKETERVWDAVDRITTEVKDYSMEHLVETIWRASDWEIAKRLVHICIDENHWIGSVRELLNAVNGLVERADENGWLPRGEIKLEGETGELLISTRKVGEECLKDHVAEVTYK